MQYPLYLAPSTRKVYNSRICDFQMYCTKNGIVFPPSEGAVITEYLCVVADVSNRPKSILKITSAALSCLYNTYNLPNPLCLTVVHNFMLALIKSGTDVAMKRTPTLPISAFYSLFQNWNSNENLSLCDLRLKVITLLSILLMLRPSDIAPRSVEFCPNDKNISRTIFKINQVVFQDDGSVSFTFHGIKNDTDRKGFVCSLPPCSDRKVDPVSALKCYIDRTAMYRHSPEDALFLTLSHPYRAISAGTVSSILREAISKAGLDGMGFSAKSFRPTGAQAAVDSHTDAKTAQQHGRWKSESVFYEHYVHSKPGVSFTDNMMSHD